MDQKKKGCGMHIIKFSVVIKKYCEQSKVLRMILKSATLRVL